ncbi:MAG: SMC-Scp complex subunit ScpB [Chloroflexota bacterium]|jgi:segregation and condensation protein B
MSEIRTPQLTLESYIEAMLFVAGEPVAIGQLCEWLDVSPQVIENALERLRDQLEGRGITLLLHDQRVQLVSHVIAAPVIRRMLGQSGAPKLTNAVSEVLTIIAYRQPITRAQIEAIRGVDCSTLVRQLQARELVTEVGRLESIGRPVLFGTTDHFLRQFGLRSLAELPPLVIPDLVEPPASESV